MDKENVIIDHMFENKQIDNNIKQSFYPIHKLKTE